jgi:hypothetical protein
MCAAPPYDLVTRAVRWLWRGVSGSSFALLDPGTRRWRTCNNSFRRPLSACTCCVASRCGLLGLACCGNSVGTQRPRPRLACLRCVVLCSQFSRVRVRVCMFCFAYCQTYYSARTTVTRFALPRKARSRTTSPGSLGRCGKLPTVPCGRCVRLPTPKPTRVSLSPPLPSPHPTPRPLQQFCLRACVDEPPPPLGESLSCISMP